MEHLDSITQRLLAAKQGVVWGPHPLLRRAINFKGAERLQQLWVSNAGEMEWRDTPLFGPQEEFIDEGDNAINIGSLLRVPGNNPDAGAAEQPAVRTPPVQP